MRPGDPEDYRAIPPVVVIDKCVTCGGTVEASIKGESVCSQEGKSCYFEVRPAPLGEPKE